MGINFTELIVPKPSHFGSGNLRFSQLNQLTVVFGKNGSGKSLYLRQIKNSYPEDVVYNNPEKGGQFSHNSTIQQEINEKPLGGRNRDKDLNDYYYTQVIGRITNFFISRGASRKENPSPNVEEIEEIIGCLLPELEIKLDAKPPYLKVVGRPNLMSLSSGERSLLSIGVEVALLAGTFRIEENEKKIIILDEPDNHLHPDFHYNLAFFINKILSMFEIQIILATHSMTLLAAIGGQLKEKASILFMKPDVESLQAKKFSKYQLEISRLLGGHALLGPLMDSPIVLVEGDDDFRVWSQIPRHGNFLMSVFPCGGGEECKKYQKVLEEIFDSMTDQNGSKKGFVVLDGDKSIPEENSTPQSYIKILKLSCHELENLYLTDEVLQSMDLSWEAAKDLIKKKATDYGEKKETLSNIGSIDRKNDDIKAIINELQNILDKKRLHWTLRIGKFLGNGPINGQIKEFLGESIARELFDS